MVKIGHLVLLLRRIAVHNAMPVDTITSHSARKIPRSCSKEVVSNIRQHNLLAI
jgi:antitoxin component of RelBE/YafQ-DinJ toxin-antitoxin module